MRTPRPLSRGRPPPDPSAGPAPLRIAVAGKGGSGKTTLAGTLARCLARGGRSVVAIDADASPDLARSLGVLGHGPAPLPTDGLLDTTGDEPALAVPFDEVRARWAVSGPDGVELLVMARPDRAGTGCLTVSNTVVRTLVRAAPPGGPDVVLDLDPTLEGFSRGVARHVDLLLLLVEGRPASLQTARRMAGLALDLGVARVAIVASQVRGPEDAGLVRALCDDLGLLCVAEVPDDPGLREAERDGRAPIDAAPGGPAVRAVRRLAEDLPHPPRGRGRVAP